MKYFRTYAQRVAIWGLVCASVLQVVAPSVFAQAATSSWDSTLLVNTEAFLRIAGGNGSEDIELQFADNATLYWEEANSWMKFSTSLYVEGDVYADGSVTVNADGDAASEDGVVNFNGTNSETLTWDADGGPNTNGGFVFSDDLLVNGDFSATGNVDGASLTISSGNVSINGVDYIFPAADGSAGYVLTTDGAGNLSWTTSAVADSDGSFVTLYPEYAGAVYYGDGSNNVGTLEYNYDATNRRNYYRWGTSQGTSQDYTISVQAEVPANFAGTWDTNPIDILYRITNAGAGGSITYTITDQGGNAVASGTMDTRDGTWTTETIASPTNVDAGDKLTVLLTMFTDSDEQVDLGEISFNWVTTTP